jgi:hypothetical protein
MPKEQTDDEVFADFFLGPEQQTLREIISAQRKINGRLYKSIEAILDALPKGPSKTGGVTVDFAKLARANKINEEVPGERIGCVSPKGS